MRIARKILRKIKYLEKVTTHGRGFGVTPAKWSELKTYVAALAQVKE